MKIGPVSYLAWFGPYLIGLLAIVYSVMLRLREPSEVVDREDRGGIVTQLLVMLGLLVVGLVLIGALFSPKDLSWRFGLMFFTGGAAVIAALLYSNWRVRLGCVSASDAFFGVGLSLLLVAFLRNYFREAPTLYLLVLSLGSWFAIAVLYYGRPNRILLAPRSVALSSMVLAGAVAIASLKYAEASGQGTLFAIDACAMVLLMCMVGSIAMYCCRPGLLSGIIGGLILLLGTWWLVGLLGNVVLDEPLAGLCSLVGSVTVLAVYLLSAASGGLRVGNGRLLGANEAGVLALLLAIACAAISMRWLGGYGVTLAAIGGLASLPLVYIMIDRLKSGGPDLELANGGAGIVAALAAIGLVRVFAENTGGTGIAVRVFESYVLSGLVLGGVLSLILASISAEWSKYAVGPVMSLTRGLTVVAVAIALVFGAAYFWRFEAIVGLMLGFAAGLFFVIAAAPFFGKQMDAPDVALGLPMFIVTCVPWFLANTIDLTREQKVAVLFWALAALALLIITTSAIRLRRSTSAV